MKVLVTGGAGYVGSVLVRALLERGHKVRVLDNLMFGGDSLLSCCHHEGFEVTVGDVTDEETVRQALTGMDVIVHLAAIVGFPACKKEPTLAEKVNVGGTEIINRLRSEDQMLIYASTGSNYGDIEVETCTEETPLKPLTEYGDTKTRAEHMLLDSGNVVVFRFATAFGISHRMRLDLLINDFTFQAVTNRSLIIYEKSFMRSFIDVRDMSLSVIFAMDNYEAMKGGVFNVGNEAMNYNKEQIAKKIREHVDYYLHFAEIGEDLDKRNYYVSYDKINALGFQTTIGMDRGLQDLIQGVGLLSIRNKYSNV